MRVHTMWMMYFFGNGTRDVYDVYRHGHIIASKKDIY